MTQEDYRALCNEIWEHNYCYYVENAPRISDYQYDLLFNKLLKWEKIHPDWIFSGSPSQRVGEIVSGGFPVISHRVPMLSLANTYSEKHIRDFLSRMERMLEQQEIEYLTELKFDGIAISVRYEKGILVEALTRGDGMKGEEITANIRTIRSLPLTLIPPFPSIMEARGEIYMPKQVFQELNQKCIQQQRPSFANPRNAAGGSLKLHDPKMVAQRKLAISFYGIADISSEEVSTQEEALQLLKRCGLPVVGIYTSCKSFTDILTFAKEVESIRIALPYQIDGIVIKIQSLAAQKKLGVTGKNYRWAVAYKFAPEQAETMIRAVTVQVGRTGILTPVAELIPVEVAGSMISRVTLHNQDEIKRKDIRVHDFVFIEKGGDVIPKIVRVNTLKRKEDSLPWEMPIQCPICSTPTFCTEGEVAVRCPNQQGCPAQNSKKILHFVSKSGMDIEHLGEKIVYQLVERGLIKNFSDIYALEQKDLFELPHFQETSVSNLLKSIEASKKVPLEKLLMALGIPHVGIETGEILAKQLGSLESIECATEEELRKIHSIGAKTARGIVEYFKKPQNRDEINKLLSFGVTPTSSSILKEVTHPFYEKKFVLTGSLANYTRTRVMALIKEKGGSVTSGINKATDYLLAGKEPGQKYAKAIEMGIAILHEEEFIQMLQMPVPRLDGEIS